MPQVKEWALLVAGCAIFAEVCFMILPEGKSRKTATLVIGFVLAFTLLWPMEDVYKMLQNIPFSYEGERTELTEKMAEYTEEQMLEVSKKYKQRVTDHISQLVNAVDGIENCKVTFVMEEDYQQESFGMVKRIYVTAYKTKKEVPPVNSLDSGFLQMAPIEKIEITLHGIQMIPSEKAETETEEEKDLQGKEIRAVLQEVFRLEESCIFVEVNDE